MKKNQPVSDIMTRDVVAVNIGKDNLYDVVLLFEKEHVRHAPVLQGKKLVGIISKTDIDRLTFSSIIETEDSTDDAVLEMLSLEQVMRHNPRTVQPGDTIKEVAEILATEEYHSLPVVEGDKLVGIVTTTDVIRYMLEHF